MNKLQFIAMSLPFGLWVSYKGMLRKANGVHLEPQGWVVFTDDYVWPIDGIKLVLKRITIHPKAWDLPNNLVLMHAEKHYDLLDLIKSGDAIDCLELAVNPYEK